MARAALGISVRELSSRTGVGDSTILRFEAGKGGILAANLERLKIALEAGGVIFFAADAHGGPGVRFRQSPPGLDHPT
ncbi:helix-turn-helix domain-containing protein [Tabrizicola sp.]|uniref:helix-turn-helix domain-containing protein n=1 Tax=Tabrizicola sp. TaxID=2005166 RepID=UPI003524D150